MNRQEVMKLLSELHKAGLANEPADKKGLVDSWSACFSYDPPRLIYKACYIYIKIRHEKFFPTPSDIEGLKKRAKWLIEIENEQRELKKLEEKKLYIEAPKVDIREGLCKGHEACPYFSWMCHGTKSEQEICNL